MKLKDVDNNDVCPEEFLDCDVIYYNDWSDYEEHGWIVIFKFFDEIFVWEYQYSVFAEDNSVIFDPYTVCVVSMVDIIKKWDEKENFS